MITLSTDKGLIRVENWDDIESRPGFERNLNPSEHSLDSIIGRYVFPYKIRCGLSNCHTPHAKGYIVVTKDGRETNIGKDCGKTYFGVDFETLSNRFERDVARAENRERLFNFSFKVEDLTRRIAELRKSERGADWVHRNIRPLTMPNTGCPEEVIRRLASMVKARLGVLSIPRAATQAEIDTQEAIEDRKLPRPHYIDEPIADIAGIEALYPENDLKSLLVARIESKIKEFEEKDIDAMTHEELRHWVKWVDSVEHALEQARQAVTYGRKLLNAKNLAPFLKILTSQADLALLRAYLARLGGT